jgi:hypothetical protein
MGCRGATTPLTQYALHDYLDALLPVLFARFIRSGAADL